MERLFHMPPLTPELCAAIKLIAPHWDFPPSERVRLGFEADQNAACWAEFEALKTELVNLPKQAKVLEIGPGMGRSLVFFSKKLRWDGNLVHAYEGDG